jgi:arsenic resistance protein ArsH
MTKILKDLPNVGPDQFRRPDTKALTRSSGDHAPRILLLYGSLRQRSFSRLATEEAARLLQAMGAETRTFNPVDCRCRMTAMKTTPRCENCAS